MKYLETRYAFGLGAWYIATEFPSPLWVQNKFGNLQKGRNKLLELPISYNGINDRVPVEAGQKADEGLYKT